MIICNQCKEEIEEFTGLISWKPGNKSIKLHYCSVNCLLATLPRIEGCCFYCCIWLSLSELYVIDQPDSTNCVHCCKTCIEEND